MLAKVALRGKNLSSHAEADQLAMLGGIGRRRSRLTLGGRVSGRVVGCAQALEAPRDLLRTAAASIGSYCRKK